MTNSKPSLKLIQARGSSVTGRHRDKMERISEVMSDLKLAIDGCNAQLSQSRGSDEFRQSVGSLARASSIFLRKLIIGDKNQRQTRLLDDHVCKKVGLKLHRIRKIGNGRQTLSITLNIEGGYVQIQKLDDLTLVPEHSWEIPIGPQSLEFCIDWPLPGMSTWIRQPSQQEPWRIREEELFATQVKPILSCDKWLGQQLIMLDNKGISLKDILRHTVNTEGAHSTNGPLLRETKTEAAINANKNKEAYILSNLKILGLKYYHIVVIETALYLYKMLINSHAIKRPAGKIYLPTFCSVSEVPQDMFLVYKDWLIFDGGMIVYLGGYGHSISHRIRATK